MIRDRAASPCSDALDGQGSCGLSCRGCDSYVPSASGSWSAIGYASAVLVAGLRVSDSARCGRAAPPSLPVLPAYPAGLSFYKA